MRINWDSDEADPAEAVAVTSARGGGAPYKEALDPAQQWTGLKSQLKAQRLAAAVGSSNFTFSAPIAHYPGRGRLPLDLNLVYNSRVWQRLTTPTPRVVFDIDGDWPAPGWTLSMGRLVSLRPGLAMVVESDGTRRPFTVDSSTTNGDQTSTTCHTIDGSGIRYQAYWDNQLGPAFQGGWLLRPDGTRVDFEWGGFASRITDANGNSIVVTYDPNHYLKQITDTCGRVIRFEYREDNAGALFLDRIWGPAPDIMWGPRSPHPMPETELVVLNYGFPDVTTSFVDPVHEPPGRITTISGIYYPATQTGYWLPNSSYTSYGQLRSAQACRDMTLTPSTNVVFPPVIGAGNVSWQRNYNYPDAGPAQSDVPTYTTMTETWEGQTEGSAVTQFTVEHIRPTSIQDFARTTTTWPDGTKSVRDTTGAPSAATDLPEGLLKSIRVLDVDGSEVQRIVANTWVLGDDGTPRLTDLDEIIAGRVAKTWFAYESAATLPTRVDQFAYSPDGQGSDTVLRRTEVTYQTEPQFLARNLRNLPKTVTVYKAFKTFNGRAASQTVFDYDETPLEAAPGISGLDERWIPGTATYDPRTATRGNPTTIQRHHDELTGADPVIEKRTYDVAGNLLASDIGAGRLGHTFGPPQYIAPVSTWLRGTQPGAPMMVVRAAAYNWDGQLNTSINSDGHQVYYRYDAAGRLRSTLSGATRTDTEYSDRFLGVVTQTYELTAGQADRLAMRRNEWRDGLQRLVGVREDADDGGALQQYRYDRRGRLSGISAPYRGQQPADWEWAEAEYDVLGRPKTITGLGAGRTRFHYDEPARPGNRIAAADDSTGTLRTVDPAGIERWHCFDALGQLKQVVEPAPDGSGAVLPTGGVLTSYSHDGNGHIVTVDVHTLDLPTQQRRFRYDCLSRLVRVYVPECGGTITETYDSAAEQWSAKFTYDQRSNLVSSLDSRGVTTLFDYGTDGLDRLHHVSYSTDGFSDTNHPVVNCPTVTYDFQKIFNLRNVETETCAGVSVQQFTRDPVYGLTSSTVTMAAAPQHPFGIDYAYDRLTRPVGTTYPALYGDAGDRRPVAQTWYQDVGGKPDHLIAVGAAGQEPLPLAKFLSYAASGRATEIMLDLVHENWAYDGTDPSKVTAQTVTQDQTQVLDLGYDYFPHTLDPGTGLRAQLSLTVDKLESSGGRSALFDKLGRLTRFAGGTSSGAPGDEWAQTYTFDLHGNRTGVTAVGDLVAGSPAAADGEDGLEYDAANRISNNGFDYDAAGNLTAARVDGVDYRYQYDVAGRLVYVNNTATAQTTGYVYGACNRRRATVVLNDGTVWPPPTGPAQLPPAGIESIVFYCWDDDHVVATYEATGPDFDQTLRWKEFSFYGGRRLLSTWERLDADQKQLRYHHRGAYSKSVVSSPQGLGQPASSAPHEAYPFGGGFVTEAERSRPFHSYEHDARTGLDYAVNRFYHPALGRFLQPDPLGPGAFIPSASQSLNSYLYCRNDPVNRTDRLGLVDDEDPCLDFGNGAQLCDGTVTFRSDPVVVVAPAEEGYTKDNGAPMYDPVATPGANPDAGVPRSGQRAGERGASGRGRGSRTSRGPAPAWWETMGFKNEEEARIEVERRRRYDRPLQPGFNPIGGLVKQSFRSFIFELAKPFLRATLEASKGPDGQPDTWADVEAAARQDLNWPPNFEVPFAACYLTC